MPDIEAFWNDLGTACTKIQIENSQSSQIEFCGDNLRSRQMCCVASNCHRCQFVGFQITI